MHRPLRRTLEAIVTPAITLIVALAASDLKRSVAKQAQLTKNTELQGSHDVFLSHGGAVADFSRARWQH
jgi:K+-sensing histidine kinase KdpD